MTRKLVVIKRMTGLKKNKSKHELFEEGDQIGHIRFLVN